MEEIWKDIEGYEGLYHVSNLGRVKSLTRDIFFKKGNKKTVKEKILTPWISKGFYYRVILVNKHKLKKHFAIHVLVAKAFIPNPNNYPFVLHYDETLPLEEAHAVGNLWWGTSKDNIMDCHAKGRYPIRRGKDNPMSKLTETYAQKIIDLIDQGFRNIEIIELVENATKSRVENIKSGKAWAHLRK